MAIPDNFFLFSENKIDKYSIPSSLRALRTFRTVLGPD